jgi:small-conductance mechanosensitive channel
MSPLLPILLITAWAHAAAPAKAAAAAASTPASPSSLNVGLGPAPAGVKRDTPQETVAGFFDACRAGDYRLAAQYLDLNQLAPGRQAEEGARLARRLKFVLDQKLWVDMDSLSTDPEGHQNDGLPPLRDEIGTIVVPGGAQAVRLQRVQDASGANAWVFSQNLVQAIGPLYDEYGPGWLGDHLPPWMLRHAIWVLELWQLFGLLLIVPLAELLRHLLVRPFTRLARGIAHRTAAEWDDEIVQILPHPVSLFTVAALVGLGSTPLHLAQPAQEVVNLVVRSAMLVALGMFGQHAVVVAVRALEARLNEGETDARRLKAIATRIAVLQHTGSGLVIVVVAALVLAQFQLVRTVGLSLLASAGVAGIVVGFAAQRSVANLFAGLQIILTQPISIGDVVIVEGEWGTIEEITFTHVVIKIWDLRRLVVPIGYFLEKPFQNWTRASTELLGTIYFYTDHSIDLAAMRAELDRVLAETDLWDGKVKGIVVTDIKNQVVEVRALISAADSGKQWDLRCLVREKMLDWLQRQGQSLPKLRLDVRNVEGGVGREHG